jgi:hypothetical protein
VCTVPHLLCAVRLGAAAAVPAIELPPCDK